MNKENKKINSNLISLVEETISSPSTLSNNKKISYLNISKLNYKDGVILKDASNINPGFGLLSNKLVCQSASKKTSSDQLFKNMNYLRLRLTFK